MNRERAETFLRLLAESELRDPARLPLSAPPLTDAPFVTLPVALRRAAWTLTTVGALDQETADGGRDRLRGRGLAGRARGFAPVRRGQAHDAVRQASAS